MDIDRIDRIGGSAGVVAAIAFGLAAISCAPGERGGGGTGGGIASGDASAGGSGGNSPSTGGTPGSGGAGSGGTNVVGGSGGSISVPTGTCPEAEVTGELAGAQPPVVLAATLTTSRAGDFRQLSIVPTSTPDSAFVAFTSSQHIAKVAPSGVSFDSTGVCGRVVRMLVNDSDVPALLVSTQADSGPDEFFSLWTPAQPTWSAAFVAKQGRCSGSFGAEPCGGDTGIDAILETGGEPRVLVASGLGTSSMTLSLFARSAFGSWVPTETIAQNNGTSTGSMILDSLGRLRIVYVAGYSDGAGYAFNQWTDGHVLASFRPSSYSTNFAAAAGLSGILGVAATSADGSIVLTYSDGISVSDSRVIPGTTPSATPCYDQLDTCETVTCETGAVASNTLSLTSTPDGTFWLAYRYLRTRTKWAAAPGAGVIRNCWYRDEISATSEVRLVRIPADRAVDPSTRWTDSFPVADPYDATPELDLAARGSRLYLAIPNDDSAHILVFDWANL
jgi:hypothetical protein